MHVIGTAGHVDHGKSTLVRALTGMDPDRFEEEKRRGLTIDLGFAWCELPSGREIGFVDVPGHERFIRNMLAGVGGIDAALFVVAADEGWMPQSAEHLDILDFLEIRAALIAVTKVDLVEADLVELVEDQIREQVRGTALEGAPLLGVSAATGVGVDALTAELDTLLERAGEAENRSRPRLFVDRSFTITGAGTVVTGTLTGGRLRVGEEVELVGSGHRARVRSLQTHRRSVDEAVPGSRVAVNLAGVDREDIRRGDALVSPEMWTSSTEFAARLRTSRHMRHPLPERGAYELYVGAAETPCRLKFLEDPPAHEGRIPALPAGADLLVQVFTIRPIPLEPGDRFIIRDVGRWETVAGGRVLDHAPGRMRRGDPDVLERLRSREATTEDGLLSRVVAERRVVDRGELGLLAGLGPHEVDAAVEEEVAAGRAFATNQHVFERSHADGLRQRAVGALATHHESHPLDAGMPREALRKSLGLESRAFAELLGAWCEEGAMVAEGAAVRLPEHGTTLAPEDRAAADRALERLREAGSSPPEAAELGLSRELLRALERLGEIAFVTPEIAYPAETIASIEATVVRLISEEGPVTVARARDAIGTSRKYAVPVLEFLDSRGTTRRDGDRRVLGPRGRDLVSSH